MIVSHEWLKAFVDTEADASAIADALTLAGLEVDDFRPAAPPLAGVVVSEIVAIAPHPDADKLRVCQVACGTDAPVQIVCGAANAALGLKAPLATIGTELPGGMKIKPAKLRGEPSSGMLCSATELGLAETADGLLELPADAPVGTPIADYLGLDDALIEIDLTPNRGDCLSMLGVAREVAVLTGGTFKRPLIEGVAAADEAAREVMLEAPDACPRYVGRVIRGVNAAAETPIAWQERLRRAGIRPISALVDITNLVLLELGQPMHAFDNAKLAGTVRVRMAAEGESLKRLDGETSNLDAQTLVIADDNGPVAMAGVMGGDASAVSDKTQDVFLEAAFFSQNALAGVARRYKLHTDASHRFERGVDFALPAQAMERATALVLELCGGTPGPVTLAERADALPGRSPVALRRERIGKVLGFTVGDTEVERILTGLEVTMERTKDGWLLTPPSHRYDMTIEVDFIEEIVRVHGYHAVPTASARITETLDRRSVAGARRSALVGALRARDYNQAITYSFIPPDHARWLAPAEEPIELDNPISSEMAAMRPSIWPGLLAAVAYNEKRQASRVRLFEHGLVFRRDDKAPGGLSQTRMIAGVASGSRNPDQWAEPSKKVDFFDVKGDLEAVLAELGLAEVSFRVGSHPALHPGQCAEVLVRGESLGLVGALHPQLKKDFDLRSDCYVFELKLDSVLGANCPKFAPLSRFPAVRRDIAVVVAESVPLAAVEAAIRASAGKQLKGLKLFDVYRGQSIDSDMKSLALGLIFQASSSTLTDDEVDAAIARIVERLQADVGGTLRS